MPVQLRLLDDAQSRRSLVWSQLPQEVRAVLVELLAKVLLEVVQNAPREVEVNDESR
jgi:hypothetical protein